MIVQLMIAKLMIDLIVQLMILILQLMI